MTVPGSSPWRAAEARRLLDFGVASRDDVGGFAWLDESGRPDRSAPRGLWITCRMTHVYAMAHLAEADPARAQVWAELAGHGIRALTGQFTDADHGGWFAALAPDGSVASGRKEAYGHAFVLLAASSGVAAGVPGAADLLADAQAVFLQRFWREDEGAAVESYAADWSDLEDYRGVNANMHTVEAFTAVGDVTGDPAWRERAARIGDRVVRLAADNSWRLPEHFAGDWTPLPAYNTDRRHDQFRPYGSTPGHWFEWARLLLALEAGGVGSTSGFADAARGLYAAGREVGWGADGSPGFVYTLDWDDTPVITERMHWVIAEAVLAADAVGRGLGLPGAGADAARWWAELDRVFVDREGGSWWHGVDAAGAVSRVTWSGKPDIYHAYQACLFPDLPLDRAAAAALRDAGQVPQ